MLRIEVENIKCGGCMNTIRRALLAVPNVQDVVIDKEHDLVEVMGNADREVVVSVLAELGYPEKGKNSLVSKAKSFVSCAVGRLS